MPVARLLVAATAVAAALAADVAGAEPPAPAAAPAPAPVPADSSQATPSAEPSALDVTLPCGLRVLVARDVSLPVAAVVLAVEVGSEDDPPELPGLVHALAFHLHQGNRELRPGEAIAAAQDAGGAHFLSTGPGQVRFESLVPVSRLDEILYIESQRLRFPTIDRGRWEMSLAWAASDVRLPARIRRDHMAELHGTTGLLHDGRAPSKALGGLVLGALAAQLSSKFTYPRSTLIIVAPEEPTAVLERVRARFADLPAASRNLPARPPPPPRRPVPDTSQPGAAAVPGNAPTPNAAPAAAPGSAPTPGAAKPGTPAAAPGSPAATPDSTATGTPAIVDSGGRLPPTIFLWPIPANNDAAAWAGAICRALNRQKRENDEPRKARLLCDYEPDTRRGALMLRTVAVDDTIGFVRARLARLAGADAPLLAAQAAFVAQATRLRVRTPLGLARQIAASSASPSGPVPGDSRPLDALTGLAALAGRPNLGLAVEDALLVVPAEVRP